MGRKQLVRNLKIAFKTEGGTREKMHKVGTPLKCLRSREKPGEAGAW